MTANRIKTIVNNLKTRNQISRNKTIGLQIMKKISWKIDTQQKTIFTNQISKKMLSMALIRGGVIRKSKKCSIIYLSNRLNFQIILDIYIKIPAWEEAIQFNLLKTIMKETSHKKLIVKKWKRSKKVFISQKIFSNMRKLSLGMRGKIFLIRIKLKTDQFLQKTKISHPKKIMFQNTLTLIFCKNGRKS
jgi:hypothetical protein